MKELLQDYPFKDCTIPLRETVHRSVYGFLEGSVIKVARFDSGREVFCTTEAALAEIADNQVSREKIGTLLQELGSLKDIVVPTSTVIHESVGGGITYTEVQEWQRDAKALGEIALGVFKLPTPTLVDLRNLFLVNMELLKKEKTHFDIGGSCKPEPPTFTERLVCALFPLFRSYNILVSPQGRVSFVDVEGLDKFSRFTKSGAKNWLKRQVVCTGFYLSLGVLNTILKLRSKSSQCEV